jgi:hypothetical protein
MVSKSNSFRRAIPAFGLALIASLALSAVAAGSASAATQHWYACEPNGGSKSYEDSACSKEVTPGLGSYGMIKLWEGTSTPSAMTGTTGFTLKVRWFSIQVEINCSTQTSSEGTVENPTGKGAGTANGTLSFSGCTVAKPSNCFHKAPITIAVKGEATEFGGKPAVKFTPVGGGFDLTFEGEKCPLKEKVFPISGSFTGIQNSATLLEFTQASSALKAGTEPVTLEGTSKMETSKGERLKLAP